MDIGRVSVRVGVSAMIVGIVFGILIGYFSRQASDNCEETTHCQDELDVAKMLYDEVDKSRLEDNLRILTSSPHIAGSKRDEIDLVKVVSESWQKSGFQIAVHPYEVLLSYPNETDPNYVAIVDQNGSEVFKSSSIERVIDESENHTNVVNPFNAYSANGIPQGDLVYINYARMEDIKYLERDLTINLTNKICIARYGKIFRGNKAYHAEHAGCAGLILYSDPYEYTVKGKAVYPNTWFLPGSGTQRGTLFLGDGDPETPNYPSLDSAWRMPKSKLNVPAIPVTPIGYDDAVKYLSRLSGPKAPTNWQGGLNITYHVGPGFEGSDLNSFMKMHVVTRNERKLTHNVIGYIRGREEPDRYVLFGSHRDAWVFGSVDPSSAQTIMLELGNIMGKAIQKGWRPRRTIILCSWGAEEYGFIGSTEWVEEFQKNLASRAVVYINLDVAVIGGYTLYAGGSPSLVDLVYSVTKSFPNPDEDEVDSGRPYLYDSWKERLPDNRTSKDKKPFIRQLGSGSDYTAFLQLPGVSVLDFGYAWDLRQGIDFYPTYHSVYETFDYMTKFVDPGFKYHQVLTRLLAEVGRRLIDYPILPINLEDYGKKIVQLRDKFLLSHATKMVQNGIDIRMFINVTERLHEATKNFQKRVDVLRNKKCLKALEIRALNDQAMQMERSFIDTNGIDDKTNFKHIIFAPGEHDRYSGIAFPALAQSLFDIDTDTDKESRWNEVRRQYSILVYHLGSAASTIRKLAPMQGASNS